MLFHKGAIYIPSVPLHSYNTEQYECEKKTQSTQKAHAHKTSSAGVSFIAVVQMLLPL